MKHTITVDLSPKGIDRLIKKVDEYERWVKRKTDQFTQALADLGYNSATISFATATYDGPRDAVVTVEHRGDNVYAVKANGESVAFIEFGSGITMGGGYPGDTIYGPGTYPIPPGKGHWDDPNGWYLPKEKGGGKSYGNPPNAPMYNAVKNLEQEFARIAQEVFSD